MSTDKTTIIAPVDEILMAIHIIYDDRGDFGLLEEMPFLVALWKANRERADWLLQRRHHVEALDGPSVEPSIIIPAECRNS